MTNLPAERPESTPALLGGQAALFENPTMLLDLDDVALKELAVLFGRHGASVFAQVRAQAGLLAWAGWFRFGEVTYSAFLLGLSKDLGVQPDTLMKWRRDVVRERRLPVPGVVKARSDAAKEGHKTAGQPSGAGRSSGKSKPIPATSKEVPAESSAGGGSGPLPAAPPAGPSSRGARTTAPPRLAPTDEAPTSPSPAPLDPSDRPPSRRQQASAIVAAFQDAEDGVGRGWTHEEATYLFARFRAERDAWATYNKASIEWADAPPAPAEKPQRRQGTITRPADRAKTNGAPVAGSLTRRTVTPMFKP